MSIAPFIPALVLAFVLLLGVALKRKHRVSTGAEYRRRGALLTKAERSFYGVLAQATQGDKLVFAKVRVADVLAPHKGMSSANWQRAFNAISAKHFDFALCDPGDCTVLLVVELDDASHGSAKAKKRDKLVNNACASAGLPLLRVRAAKGYAVEAIRNEIAQALDPSGEPAGTARVEPTL